MQTIYIETSIVSFLRENSSAAPDSVERQVITRKWWNLQRHRYELVSSQYVLDEANMGSAAHIGLVKHVLRRYEFIAMALEVPPFSGDYLPFHRIRGRRGILAKEADDGGLDVDSLHDTLSSANGGDHPVAAKKL